MRFRGTPLDAELVLLTPEDQDNRLRALWREFKQTPHFWLLVGLLRDLEQGALERIRQRPTISQPENAMVMHVIDVIRRRIEGFTADQETPPAVDWYDDELFLAEKEEAETDGDETTE